MAETMSQIWAWLSQNADWVLVALFGGGVGFADLITRFRDEPFRAVRTMPGVWYIVLNALASMFALALSRAFGWTSGVGISSSDPNPWIAALAQSVAAGFGAIALLRTTFTFHAGDNEVTVGPRSFVEAVLKTTDNAVDRKRARERDKAISKAMKDISFSEAHLGLPAYVFNLLQGVPQEQQDQVGEQVRKLNATTTIRHTIKARILGLYLLNLVGEGVLLDAVTSLGAELKGSDTSTSAITDATSAITSTDATTNKSPSPPDAIVDNKLTELLNSSTLANPKPSESSEAGIAVASAGTSEITVPAQNTEQDGHIAQEKK
ncbi:MAG TPA: hypothetical protein VGE45_11395 [Chloroflexia bacterium]|jgi:hypothetical protein